MATNRKVLVSGPINWIRLEDNHKRSVVLLCDYHLPVDQQYQCADATAPTITQYLANFFNRAREFPDETWDVMVEMYRSMNFRHTTEWVHRTDMYIRDVRTLINQELKFSIKNKRVRVKRSVKHPNLRFHFADIRDWNELAYKELERHGNAIEQAIDRSYSGWFQDVENLAINMRAMLEKERRALLDGNKITPIIKKLREQYRDEGTKQAIRSEIDRLKPRYEKIDHEIGKIVETAKAMYEYGNQWFTSDDLLRLNPGGTYGIPRKELQAARSRVYEHLDTMFAEVSDLYCVVMDLYCCRRMLDKQYIKRTILYCGLWHGVDIASILVRHFGFRVTHACHASDSLDVINQALATETNIEQMCLRLQPRILTQCCDISAFPPMFR